MNTEIIVWLVLAIVLGVIESLTVSLLTIWIAIGALGATIAAALGANILIQCLVFIIVSGVLLIFTRPLVKKFMDKKGGATNADRIIGEEGRVIIKIEQIENKGQVRVRGQIWSATEINGKDVEVGELVIVEKIQGVHVIVRKKDIK
ncbi:MAG: NfeD family protein [Oscillospiraceae bacterium]